jgi:hypothetical protein
MRILIKRPVFAVISLSSEANNMPPIDQTLHDHPIPYLFGLLSPSHFDMVILAHNTFNQVPHSLRLKYFPHFYKTLPYQHRHSLPTEFGVCLINH